MIYKRTVAAFMSDCVTLKKKYVIKNGNYNFEANEAVPSKIEPVGKLREPVISKDPDKVKS